jgi:hypothetical protein
MDPTETQIFDQETLKKEWDRFFEKYWEYMGEFKRNPQDSNIERIFRYYESNIAYIEKYMEILKTTNDKAKLVQLIQSNDLYKSWTDILYNPNGPNNSPTISSPKISVVE